MLLTLLSNQKAATVTLYPPLVANTSQFYAATVTPGTVTLQPTLLVNTNVFYSATVSSTVTLQPARYNNTNTFYAVTVQATNTLLPARYDNTNAFYAATVSATASIRPARFNNTNTFYSPKVTQSANVLVGGGGGEDSYSSKTPNPRGRVKGIGFANERAQHEAALLARFEKTSNTLSDSKLLSARQTAKKLNAYISDKGTAEALQKQLDKLQAQLSVKLSNDDNQNQLNADLQAAADEVQEFIRDEQDAIDLLTFNDEKENELLLMFAGF